jgi:hypothetical protein
VTAKRRKDKAEMKGTWVVTVLRQLLPFPFLSCHLTNKQHPKRNETKQKKPTKIKGRERERGKKKHPKRMDRHRRRHRHRHRHRQNKAARQALLNFGGAEFWRKAVVAVVVVVVVVEAGRASGVITGFFADSYKCVLLLSLVYLEGYGRGGMKCTKDSIVCVLC